ncbi:hypothetical protein BKP64_15170 [Marinobacter salinus]|uniref:EAL domain-containing protein n=1 Tax=Marinobacter salinus TaxID=1874317 RepID=A0A1D9GP70_9GAMM|nr:EAL domain-containing protein [Marinobacter salinus]AOY89399.1 hypothetical protein BKP64_15170 [Marinobacter salinus]
MTGTSIERQRLAALERLGILDTPPEERFERLTRIARQYYKVKTALFSILDADTVIGNLEVCRDLGADISLDDFGTGYSSRSYSRKLPAQEIKIDQSFVQDMLRCDDDSMIVEAILSLSHSFKRRTVAEGIETVELEARLIELGCETGQGFLYSRPLPLSEALEWAKGFIWGSHYSVD